MPGVCCAPFVLTLMFSPIPSHLLYTCSPEHSLPPDKRERRDANDTKSDATTAKTRAAGLEVARERRIRSFDKNKDQET